MKAYLTMILRIVAVERSVKTSLSLQESALQMKLNVLLKLGDTGNRGNK